MESKEKVSIIMATYNRAHFIEETLHAIQKQTYQNWECLIIDDGGDDNTLQVVAPFLSEDKRFSFMKRPSSYGKGLPGCRNYGLDTAEGDFIIFFDDDDIPHPQNLELCVNELNHTDLQFCRYQRTVFTGDFQYEFDTTLDFGKTVFTKNDLSKMIDHTIPFNSCQVMWSKSCFAAIRFNESLMYAEEWECYVRILSKEIKGICIDKILFYGRKHPNSNTGEFYNNNPTRRDSNKKAIELVARHLSSKELLTPYLFTYLSGQAISFRDPNLIKRIIKSTTLSLKQKYTLQLRYYTYPIWVVYTRAKKSIFK